MPRVYTCIDWKNLEFSNCKILEPINNENIKGCDKWKIECHCGKIFIAKPSQLKNFHTKSCGCIHNNFDWTNKEYFNCKIISPVDINKRGGSDKWNILCHCGKIFNTAVPTALKAGNTKSCGCLANIRLVNFNKETKRKYNYYNFISDFNVKIIKPKDKKLQSAKDLWLAICPICNKEFFATPANIIQLNTKSCGCLSFIISQKNLKGYHIRKKIKLGLDPHIYITKRNQLIRNMIFAPIQKLIMIIDDFTCYLCYKRGGTLNVHHIDPISNQNITNKESFYPIYDINNLVTLCKKCHKELAHDGQPTLLNKEIQEELKVIVSMRLITKEIKEEYNRIVINQIKPWIENFLQQKP